MTIRTLILCVLVFPLPAAADFSIGGKLGTTGAGIEGLYHFDDQFAFRATLNFGEFNREVEVNGNDYDAAIDMASVALQMDIFPRGKSFYFTGGFYFHDNRLGGEAIFIDDEIGIGTTLYPSADITSLSGELSFERVAPYIGLGWRLRNNQPGLNFGIEVGLLYHGKGDVFLIAEGPITADPDFQDDLEIETDDIEELLGVAKLFPVLEGRISYRF